MAITVAGKNYTLISTCDTITSQGTWSGSPVVDSANKKEGVASLAEILKAAGLNILTFTPTSSIDMSGTKHFRAWIIDTALGLLDTKANGGIRVGLSDGVNTGYWYLAGSDTYEGGWLNLVFDVSSGVDSGTKPTAMNAITSIDFVLNQTVAGKNVDNFWVDHISLCDGLVAYGDDSGGYFDFENIYQADLTTLGIGVIRKIGGQYFSTGSIEIGDSAGVNGCKFQAKSQVFVFEDRPVNTALYGFNIVDNGTGTTEFILGDVVGGAGIQGCVIRTADEAQTPKFYVNGFTDTDVDNFKLYGSTFFDAGTITFGESSVNSEVLGCSFEACLQVIPNNCSVDGCFFIGTSDADSALLWNETIVISNCSFIGNTLGAGIEHPSAVGTPYSYDNLQFSGNTYDVLNSATALTVNKTNGSNPSTYEGAIVTFVGSVLITINVEDKEGVAITDAQTSVYLEVSPFTELMNEDTVGGVATESYSGATPVSVVVKVRKSETTDDPRYFGYSSVQVIGTDGLTLFVTLEVNPFL